VRLIHFVVLHPWRTLVGLLRGTLLGFTGFYAYQVTATFGDITEEWFRPEAAREAIEAGQQVDPGVGGLIAGDALEPVDFGPVEPEYPNAFGEPIPDEVFESYLLLGSDASGALA